MAEEKQPAKGTAASQRPHVPRAARRKMPLGRAATLVIGERTHVVGLGDLSVTGAYLISTAPAQVGREYELRLVALPGRTGLALRARVVRAVQAGEEAGHHPCGVAVEFVDLDAAVRARLLAFVQAGLGREP